MRHLYKNKTVKAIRKGDKTGSKLAYPILAREPIDDLRQLFFRIGRKLQQRHERGKKSSYEHSRQNNGYIRIRTWSLFVPQQ
jgi:hypothetical protein